MFSFAHFNEKTYTQQNGHCEKSQKTVLVQIYIYYVWKYFLAKERPVLHSAISVPMVEELDMKKPFRSSNREKTIEIKAFLGCSHTKRHQLFFVIQFVSMDSSLFLICESLPDLQFSSDHSNRLIQCPLSVISYSKSWFLDDQQMCQIANIWSLPGVWWKNTLLFLV